MNPVKAGGPFGSATCLPTLADIRACPYEALVEIHIRRGAARIDIGHQQRQCGARRSRTALEAGSKLA